MNVYQNGKVGKIKVPVLCISISSFNRGDRVENLVREILKVQSCEITVVVVDDNSTDDTIERLSRVEDRRLHIFQNSNNKGARANWFETINHGYGKYILHLLDRDWIRIEYLQIVINILRNENIDFGYIGALSSCVPNKAGLVKRYSAGREALEKFAFTLVHPSGFLVKRSIWKDIPNKEKFFVENDCGIYPHSYIFALLAEKYSGVIISYPLVKIVTSYVKYKSNFYQNNRFNMPYWWTPEAHKEELEALTWYGYRHMNLQKAVLQRILQYRFYENLYAATIGYQYIVKNPLHISHYGLKVRYIGQSELIKINVKFVWKYLVFVVSKCRGIFSLKFAGILISIGKKNMKDILQYTWG